MKMILLQSQLTENYVLSIAQLLVPILYMNVGHYINQENLSLLYSPILSFSCRRQSNQLRNGLGKLVAPLGMH